MSDDTSTESAEQPKGGNKLVLILLAFNIVAVLGGGAALYFAISSKAATAVADDDKKTDKSDDAQQNAAGAEGENGASEKLAIPPGQPGPLLDLDPFVVNLDEQGSNRYLKIKLSLELAGEPARPYLEARLARIRDKLIAYLSSLSFDAVRGLQGKTLVRDGVHERVAEIAPGMVTHVFITDFVVQ